MPGLFWSKGKKSDSLSVPDKKLAIDNRFGFVYSYHTLTTKPIFFAYRLAITNFFERTDLMMPVVLASKGEENIIKKVGGNPEVKRHLENLGFTPGGSVTLINSLGGNVILKVKESRIALNEEMARKIFI